MLQSKAKRMLTFKATSILLVAVVSIGADTCAEKRFKRVKNGPSLHPADIISSHSVSVMTECFTLCTHETSCVSFNHRARKSDDENCQLSNKTIDTTIGLGEWTSYQNIQVIAAPVECGDPGTPSGGHTKGIQMSHRYTVGSIVTFHCDSSGHVIEGASSATCLSDSTWSSPAPKCVSSFIRLRGGGRSDRGRVELYRSSAYGWYTACDHDWDMKDAKVVCRELGFAGASAVRLNAYYGQGTGLRITDMHPNCKGTESSLVSCSKISLWRQNCGHNEDVGVDCVP